MSLQIPIYRAKKINNDEYIEGFYYPRFYMCMGDEICSTISRLENGHQYEIDLLTIAIHFNGMIDKNGKKIFASLNENGKGGDILLGFDNKTKYIVYFNLAKGVYMSKSDKHLPTNFDERLEVIGIKND